MKKTKHFKQILLLAAAMFGLAAGAQAQYASFFGDSVTEYSIVIGFTCYYDDDDITFVSNGEYDPDYMGACKWTQFCKIKKNHVMVFNNMEYYVLLHGIEWIRPPESDTIDVMFTMHNFYKQYNYYIREDTTLGRIYRYLPETDEEVIMCDMSLGIGDSVHLYDFTPVVNMWGYTINQGSWVHVDSVFHHNGRKVIVFDSNDPSFDYYGFPMYFIEGIGPWFGPVGGDFCLDECLHFPHMPILLGVRKDYEVVHITSSRLGLNQFGVGVPETDEEGISVFPNPATDMVSVSVPDMKGEWTIYITDVLGTVVAKTKVVNAESALVDVSGLSSGVYTILINDGRKIHTSKFVKQ